MTVVKSFKRFENVPKMIDFKLGALNARSFQKFAGCIGNERYFGSAYLRYLNKFCMRTEVKYRLYMKRLQLFRNGSILSLVVASLKKSFETFKSVQK